MNRPIFSRKEAEVALEEVTTSEKHLRSLLSLLDLFAKGELTHHEFAEKNLRLLENALETFEARADQMHIEEGRAS